jgi:hypothetical protein
LPFSVTFKAHFLKNFSSDPQNTYFEFEVISKSNQGGDSFFVFKRWARRGYVSRSVCNQKSFDVFFSQAKYRGQPAPNVFVVFSNAIFFGNFFVFIYVIDRHLTAEIII